MRRPDRTGTDRSTDWSSPETAVAVLTYLQQQARGGVVAVSLPELGAALSIGRTTAYRAVRRLVDTGRLQVSRIGTSRDYPTHYRVLGASPTNSQESAA